MTAQVLVPAGTAAGEYVLAATVARSVEEDLASLVLERGVFNAVGGRSHHQSYT